MIISIAIDEDKSIMEFFPNDVFASLLLIGANIGSVV